MIKAEEIVLKNSFIRLPGVQDSPYPSCQRLCHTWNRLLQSLELDIDTEKPIVEFVEAHHKFYHQFIEDFKKFRSVSQQGIGFKSPDFETLVFALSAHLSMTTLNGERN